MNVTDRAESALSRHRAQKTSQGFIRVEVSVLREDAGLVRHMAAALSDPARQVDARRLLRDGFVPLPAASLKALLASAPLDGVELDRGGDTGRDVDL